MRKGGGREVGRWGGREGGVRGISFPCVKKEEEEMAILYSGQELERE